MANISCRNSKPQNALKCIEYSRVNNGQGQALLTGQAMRVTTTLSSEIG